MKKKFPIDIDAITGAVSNSSTESTSSASRKSLSKSTDSSYPRSGQDEAEDEEHGYEAINEER